MFSDQVLVRSAILGLTSITAQAALADSGHVVGHVIGRQQWAYGKRETAVTIDGRVIVFDVVLQTQ